MVEDPLAEGLALAGVGQGVVECSLGQAGGDGGDAEAAGVESGERDLEALALLADEVVGGEADGDAAPAAARGRAPS